MRSRLRLNRRHQKTLEKYGLLENVPSYHRNTEDFFIFSISHNPENFNYVKDKYLSKLNFNEQYNFYLKLVQQTKNCFEHVPKEFSDYRLKYEAFKNNPKKMHEIFSEDEITNKMCLYAVKNNPYSFTDVPWKNRTKNLCKFAMFLSNNKNMRYIHCFIPIKYRKPNFYHNYFKKFGKTYCVQLYFFLSDLGIKNDSTQKIIKNMSYYYF
jgi:hypothetical protein